MNIAALAAKVAQRAPSNRDLVDVIDRCYAYIYKEPYTAQSADTRWFGVLLLNTRATNFELYTLAGALTAKHDGKTTWEDIVKTFARYAAKRKVSE